MPKVIFRPNPTPPPFVPPTPPEPTNVVVFSKYPFEAFEPIFVYFDNVEVPQATDYAFQAYDNATQEWTEVMKFQPPLPNESNPAAVFFQNYSSDIGGYRFECFIQGVSIEVVPLALQTE